MQSLHYNTIKHRAIELLQSGFEGKSFDEIKTGESWYRTMAIQQTLQNAVTEIQAREAAWMEENGKRTVLLRPEFDRLVTELKRFIRKSQ